MVAMTSTFHFQEAKVLSGFVCFESTSRHYVCIFEGAKLLYFSRGFIIGVSLQQLDPICDDGFCCVY
jgi:hypothetical protein